jgi:hypothetical protein
MMAMVWSVYARNWSASPIASPVSRYKGRRLRTWRNRLQIAGLRCPLSMANDLDAIQATLKRVDLALSAGNVDAERLRLVRWGLQMMASNLRNAKADRLLYEQSQSNQLEGISKEKSAWKGSAGASQAMRQIPPVQLGEATGAKIIPFNSIFYDKSQRFNQLPVNSRQLTDSKEAEGRGRGSYNRPTDPASGGKSRAEDPLGKPKLQ